MKFSKLTDRISDLGSDKWLLHLEARKLKKNNPNIIELTIGEPCLLYTSDAADE